MTANSSIPDDIPIDQPNAARMYDYFLGGHHNFAIDRSAAEQVLKNNPDAALSSCANRAFLRRMVTFLVDQDIDQFLDLGSGIPTVGNVHEVAQKANPAAHVVYVDNDSIAVRHSQAILQGNVRATVIQADVRQPAQILNHPDTMRLLDFNKPVAVLMLALLHFIIDDEEAYSVIRTLRDAMAAGSYLTISHGTHEGFSPEVVAQAQKLYAQSTNPFTTRLRVQIEPFFRGFDLVEPGLVYAPSWRPEGRYDLFLDQPERSGILVGVACKPEQC